MLTALRIDAQHRGLLRARLKNLQRLGLPGTAPGKGARARYTRAQLGMWLLAMLVADTGIDPTIVVRAIKAQWKELAPWIAQATDVEAQSGRPVWVVLRPGLAGAAWGGGGPSLLIEMLRPDPRSNELIQLVMGASARDKWVSLLNFSRSATRLETAL